VGYNFVANVTSLSSLILAFVASQNFEITRNSDQIWSYSSSSHPRSSILVSIESSYATFC